MSAEKAKRSVKQSAPDPLASLALVSPRLVTLVAIGFLGMGMIGWQLRSTTIVDTPGATTDSLQQEREKSQRMARLLDHAWHELRLQAVALAESVAEKEELTGLRAALSQQSAASRDALAQATARNRALEEQLLVQWNASPNSAPDEKPLEKTAPPRSAPRIEIAVPLPTTEDRPFAPFVEEPASPTLVDKSASRLMLLARSLLAQGDISGARTVLEHAAEAGDGSAIYALAQTYDPIVLSNWGTFGTQGDALKAQELYARATANGYQQQDGRPDANRR